MLSPIKNPLFLGLDPKTLKKPIKYSFKVGLKRKEEDSKKFFFFFIFPIFVVKKILKKVDKHSRKILTNKQKTNSKKTLKKIGKFQKINVQNRKKSEK